MRQNQKITLDEVFSDKEDLISDELLVEFSTYGLLSTIIRILTHINKHFKKPQEELKIYGITMISHIISSAIVQINEHIRNGQLDSKTKKQLQSNCNLILHRIIRSIKSRIPSDDQNVFSDMISITISETCEMFQYDHNELIQYLENDKRTNCQAGVTYNSPRFVWRGSSSGFNLLLKMTVELGICNNCSEFEKLFAFMKEDAKTILNSTRPDYVLQYLVCLKESGLVGVTGIRGFYSLLSNRVVDFDLKFLKMRSAQRRVDTVKNLITWSQNQSRFNQCIKEVIGICH